MIDPQRVVDVDPTELLGRYVLHGSHIRPSSQTVKPDAFMPHPYRELSVTRHLQATEAELTMIGEEIARAIGKRLHGRADLHAAACLAQQLDVRADPVAGNPNHANVCGWPAEKPAQKIIAQELAASAAFVAVGREGSD